MFRYLLTQGRVIIQNQPRRMRRKLWGIGLLALFLGFVEMAVAGLVSILGVALVAPQSVLQVGSVKSLFAHFPVLAGSLQNQAFLLTAVLACVVLSVLGKNVLLGVLTYLQAHYVQEVSTFFGAGLFRSYVRKPYTWHLQQNAAELLLFFDYRTHVGLFLGNLLTFMTQTVIAGALLLGGLIFAPGPSLIVFGFTGAAAAVTFKFAKMRIHRHAEAITAAGCDLYKRLMAGLHGIRDVQVYRQERPIYEGAEKALRTIIPHNAMVTTLSSLPAWTLEFAGMFTLLVTLASMVYAGSSIAAITGTLSLLAAMAWRLLPCTNKSVNAIVTIQGNRPYLDYFFSGLDLADLHVRGSDAPLPSLSFSGSIVLEDVSFRYPHGERDSLDKISLSIPKRGIVGIIGPSGAGKSTLIGILTGLLPPTSGTVRIDGRPLALADYKLLRSLIGYVPQSPYLMDATLAENIALSSMDEPINEAKILAVCRMAALDFWEQLPAGLATPLGERGLRISGGQAQRVAIARALYAAPELLVFDEATSALDGATENLIQQTIVGLREHTTVVMIAHRLSTVESCDWIYWVDAGRIIASGPPTQVLPEYRAHETRVNAARTAAGTDAGSCAGPDTGTDNGA